jgi:hypothetical protein
MPDDTTRFSIPKFHSVLCSQMTWDRKLARPITLSDGRTLATLRCAAECLIATFDGISHWPALEHARDLLMRAAETGNRKDVAAAPDQLTVVLGQRKVLG